MSQAARVMMAEDVCRLARVQPGNPEELHAWVWQVLGLNVPRRAVCAEAGHCGPFEYLKAAFFEEFSDAVVWANRGGGKTMLGALVTLLDALFKPPVGVRILGGSLEQSRKMYGYLRRLVVPRFSARLAGRLGPSSPLTSRRVQFANGSEVEILAQSERSVRGNRVQKMRCDEVELFDSDVWTSCQLVTESRARGPAVGHRGPGEPGNEEESGFPRAARKSAIRNPRSPAPPGVIRGAVEAFSTLHRAHGLMHRIIDEARGRGSPVFRWCVLEVLERCRPEDRDCRGCPLGDDCRGRARQGRGYFRIDDAIAARQRVSRETWEAEMLCLRPSRRGAVFPAFSRQRHVRPVRWRREWTTFRAMDFGYVHPFVCLWMQVAPSGDVEVLGEYVQTRQTLAAHIRRLRELDPGPVRMSYCDPAGGQAEQISGTNPRAELRAAGIATRARPSAITDGLDLVRRFLEGGPGTGRPGLRVDPSCERLIMALEAYHYPDPGSGNPEVPVKDGVHDHLVDALRYFFINHFGRPSGKLIERLY